MTQSDALTILKTGANVFLTGEPGSGKTHTLREYIAYLRAHDIDPVVTASTGIAATHIGGMTIHSWSGIGANNFLTEYDIDRIASIEHVAKRIGKAKVLIIDEISMLSGSALHAVDAIMRAVRGVRDPFGGVQVVFVGDFFQLPPVSASGRNRPDESDFAFQSLAWKHAQPVVCYLSEQHRQADADLLSILCAARGECLEEIHWQLLYKRRVKADVAKNETKLFTHNKDVDVLNNAELKKLPGKVHTFDMTHKGKDTLVAGLVRGCLSPEKLELKIGARVMCTKNNPGRGFVNGTLGKVVGFSAYGGYPIIETIKGEEVLIEPMSWQVEEDGKVKAEITQVPLRLAWAVTVHKSQGMTLSAATIDLSAAFEYGQGYVALSRLSSLAGLELLGIHQNALAVHPTVSAMDAYFQNESAKTEGFLANLNKTEIDELQRKFIAFCGGSVAAIRKSDGKKLGTHDATLALVRQGHDLENLCRERNLKAGTIIDHLHVLLERGDITFAELAGLAPVKLQKALSKIYRTFDMHGTDALKPVFEELRGAHSYDDLKFARILYKAM